MPTANNPIKFIPCSKSAYDNLEVKDEDTLYFITDEYRIYVGSNEYTKSLVMLQDAPTSSTVGVDGKLYYYAENRSLYTVHKVNVNSYSWGQVANFSDISGKEDSANKVEVIQSSTSKSQYPSVNAMAAYVTNAISNKENTANKVTSLSSESTNTQYPSAKAVYDQLALKANSEDIPEYLRDLTDGDKAIIKYEALSAPPTSETTDSYVVPCLWEYNGDLWYVYEDTGTGGHHLYSSILLTVDIPTNISAFINDVGYLTAQGITGKMDLAQIRASIDDDTQVKQGQFLVVGGNVWLKTGAYGAAGHLVLEDQANRVSAIGNTADNLHYPTALAVKNYVDTVLGNVETLLSQV